MQENIDYSSPNDGLGDKLRNAFIKVQNNFTELYNGKVDKISGKGLSKNDFTDLDKAKLDGIEAGAQVNVQSDWGETDPLSDSFILNKPPALYSAFGYFHVADLATQTTPLAFVASTPLQLTNDGGGAFTNYEQAPYGVSSIWNTSTNKFEFEKLSVGDAILISADLSISTTSVNQNLRLYIKLGIGTPSERDLLIDSWNEKSVVTFEEFIKDVSFSIDNEDWRDAPAEIYILSDDDGSVKVNGWYVPIIRKSVNVIDIQGSQSLQQVTDIGNATTNYIEVPMLRLKEGALEVDLSSVALTATRELFAPDKNGTIATEEDTVAKVSTSGVERAYIINADGSQGTKATSEFKDVLEFADFASFPTTGETEKIYLALDTNKTYRWTGSAYVQIGGSSEEIWNTSRYANWRILKAEALGGNQAAITFTNSLSFINTGTAATKTSTYSTGNFIDTIRRIGLTSAATAGAASQRRVATGVTCSMKSGFYFCADTISEDAATVATAADLVGLGVNFLSTFGNAEPSTTTACILLAYDSTDTNMQIMHNDNTGICTKIDLGANFPARTNATDLYRLELFCATNGVEIKYRVTRLNTGHQVSGVLTTNIPTSAVPLALGFWRGNRSTALAVTKSFSQITIATPY